MKLSYEAGTEKWIKWAKMKLTALITLRTQLRLPKLQKTYIPENGTMIHIMTTDWDSWIRITGGTVEGLKYLYTVTSDTFECDGTVTNTIQWVIDSCTEETDAITGDVTYSITGRIRRVQRYNNTIVWADDWTASTYTRVTHTEVTSGGGGGTMSVQGGTMEIVGLGTVPIPQTADGQDGYSADGTLYWTWDETNGFQSYTEAEMSAQFGGLTVIYHPNGVFYDIGPGGGGGDVTTVTVTETWVDFYWDTDQIINGTRETEIIDSGTPTVTDSFTLDSYVTALGTYPASNQDDICAGPNEPSYEARFLSYPWADLSAGSGFPSDISTVTQTLREPAPLLGVTYDPWDDTDPTYPGYSYTAQSWSESNSQIPNPFGSDTWSNAQEWAWIWANLSGYVAAGTEAPLAAPFSDPLNPAYADYQADVVIYEAAYAQWLLDIEELEDNLENGKVTRIQDTSDAEAMTNLYINLRSSAFSEDPNPFEYVYSHGFSDPTTLPQDTDVVIYTLEYDYTLSGTPGTSTQPPGGATITAVRVKSGRKAPLYFGTETRTATPVSKFVGKEIEISTFKGNAVAIIDTDYTAQREAFLTRLASVDNDTSLLSDEDKIMSLFFDDLPQPVV